MPRPRLGSFTRHVACSDVFVSPGIAWTEWYAIHVFLRHVKEIPWPVAVLVTLWLCSRSEEKGVTLPAAAAPTAPLSGSVSCTPHTAYQSHFSYASRQECCE